MLTTGEPPFRSVRTPDRSGLRNAPRTVLVVVAVVVLAVVGTYVATWSMVATRLDSTGLLSLDRDPQGELRNVVVALSDRGRGVVDGVFLLQHGGEREEPAVLVLPVNLEVDVADRGVLRLSEVAARGGMSLLVEEVAEYTELDVHHYVRINRRALAAAIDRNGGIMDCPPEGALACPNVLGQDVLDALGRPRGAVSGRARVEATVDAVALVAGEVARPLTALDPRRALRWSDEWSRVLRTDLDPGPFELRGTARALADVDPGTLEVRVLPGLVDGGRLTVTPEEAAMVLEAFASGSPMPGDIGVDAPRRLAPRDVTVRVLNGVGRPGVAGEMAEFLVDRGFTVADVDNAPRFSDREPTSIGYRGDGGLVVAELVASFMPGAEVEELVEAPPDGVDVVVTVGVNGTG